MGYEYDLTLTEVIARFDKGEIIENHFGQRVRRDRCVCSVFAWEPDSFASKSHWKPIKPEDVAAILISTKAPFKTIEDPEVRKATGKPVHYRTTVNLTDQANIPAAKEEAGDPSYLTAQEACHYIENGYAVNVAVSGRDYEFQAPLLLQNIVTLHVAEQNEWDITLVEE